MSFKLQATDGSFLCRSICLQLSNVMLLSPPLQLEVPVGCKVDLKSHMIQVYSATIESDLETIHYEWFCNSNVVF
jgi:hypothetical protein